LHKPVILTAKEISRQDNTFKEQPFTIVVRPQQNGGYWVAAINCLTGCPLLGWESKVGQQYIDSKSDIKTAIREIGRDLHKHTGYITNMTMLMRSGRDDGII
jgi:hypothetical protein